MHIYVNAATDTTSRSALLSVAGQDSFFFGSQETNTEESLSALSRSEVVYGSLTREELTSAGDLEWLQLDSVGLDSLDSDTPWPGRRAIQLTNLGHLGCDAVADTALAGILALTRGIYDLTVLKERLEWRSGTFRSSLRLLAPAQVLLVGYGAIGQAVKTRLEGFGCTDIIHIRRSPMAGEASLADLASLLPASDLVISSLPSTSETRGLFNERCLLAFRPGSYFVNVGRGDVLDERALVQAVKSGHLAGAVLDVTLDEPLQRASPMWGIPNLLLTQHTAGGATRELVSKAELFTENLGRYRVGLPLLHRVDLSRGY